MAKISMQVNGQSRVVDTDPDMRRWRSTEVRSMHTLRLSRH
jgi:hypothetical protein